MDSRLDLTLTAHQGRSQIATCYVTPPYKILPLPHLHHAWTRQHGALPLMHMSASPGLLAGDTTHIQLHIETGAGLHLQTPAYNRVLSMPHGQSAQQNLRITLADHARLCYTPQPTVLHRHASLHQSTHIELGEQTQLIWSDILTSGRLWMRDPIEAEKHSTNQNTTEISPTNPLQHGERFAFTQLKSQWRLSHRGRLIIADHFNWQPQQRPLSVIGQMEDYQHIGNWYAVHTLPYAHSAECLKQLHTLLEHTQNKHNQHRPQLQLGLSHWSHHGAHCLILRGMAKHSESLYTVMQAATEMVMTWA